MSTFHSIRRLAIVTAIHTVVATPAAVFAEEFELLATWDVGTIVGSQEIFESRWPAFVYLLEDNEFRAPLFEELVLEGPFPVGIEDTVSAANEPDFSEFVELLTDGVNHEILVLQWTDSGPGSGGGGGSELFDLEFMVPRFGPDLTGYVVDHITQTLTVDIDSPGSDPFGDGIWTDWSVFGQYQFFGTVVPEPTTLACLVIGASMMKRTRRRP